MTDDIDHAISTFGAKPNRRRLRREIAEIIKDFQRYAVVDEISLPNRRKRSSELRQLAAMAKNLSSRLQKLPAPDQERIGQLDRSTLGDMPKRLELLASACTDAEKRLPGKSGGVNAKLALAYLTQSCLVLYENESRHKATATDDGPFMRFVQQVYALASHGREASIDRAVREAVEARKANRGLFAIRVMDRT